MQVHKFQKILETTSELRDMIRQSESKPEPNFLSLKTLLPVHGSFDVPLAATSRMWVVLKTYASGGENELHAHPNEDHLFAVLQGQAEFFGPEGECRIVKAHECVLLPRGTYYYFKALGGEPLVMLRVGTVVDPEQDALYRVDIEGELFDGFSEKNHHTKPTFGETYFE